MKYTLKLTKARTSARGHLLLDWTLNPAGWRKREPWADGTYAVDAYGVMCGEWSNPEIMDNDEYGMLDAVTDSWERAGLLALLLVVLGRVTLTEWEPYVQLPEAALLTAARKINAKIGGGAA
ncbi:MAG: hypothetical protein J1E42_09180 [Akkermansiaceae bacterium]|nr:hypothetical protein [Akkermansiaceae bacterium]